MNVLLRRCPGQRPSGSGLALAVFVILSAGLAWAGCSRAHLSANHGRAYREIFAAQDANPHRQGSGKSVHGLDSQEAAIIAGNYRRALSPKAEPGSNQGQLVMMNPNRAAAEGAMAPSVPQSSGN